MKTGKHILVAAILAIVTISLPIVLASLIAEPPYKKSAVFNDISIGDLWNDQAKYVDTWYAIEAIDENTYIIGEPRSFQYNSSYLIIGNDKAILLDAGTGERPEKTSSMKEMAEKLTDKPITLMLSHFHVDHIGDLDEFEGIVMIDLPYLRARVQDRQTKKKKPVIVNVSVLETVDGAREITVVDWIKPNAYIDLGGRNIQVLSTPGHTFESLTLVDHENGYAFTGDFMYQHLGGFIVFLPGSNLPVYVESIDALLSKTKANYRFFGAHGLPEYGTSWIKEVQREFVKVRNHSVDLSLSETFIIPGLPLRLHQEEQILIYVTPFLDSVSMFSRRFLVTAAMGFALMSILFYAAFQYIGKSNR